jgi:peroxiredoxin
MKRNIKRISLAIAIVIVSFLTVAIILKIRTKFEARQHSERLPIFSFLQINGKNYSRDSIPENVPNVIINYFDPDCDHCQYMTKQIIANINKIPTCQILMISNADSLDLKKFILNYKLVEIKNIVVLRDPRSDFYRIWGSAVTPSFFIYAKSTTVKTFLGETKIENIIAALK